MKIGPVDPREIVEIDERLREVGLQMRDLALLVLEAARELSPRRRPPRTFVDGVDGWPAHRQVFCADCIEGHRIDVDLSLDGVQCWQESSDGWTSVPVCDECKSSIVVTVDGGSADENKQKGNG